MKKENFTNTESNIQKDDEDLEGNRVNTEKNSEKLDKNPIIHESSTNRSNFQLNSDKESREEKEMNTDNSIKQQPFENY